MRQHEKQHITTMIKTNCEKCTLLRLGYNKTVLLYPSFIYACENNFHPSSISLFCQGKEKLEPVPADFKHEVGYNQDRFLIDRSAKRIQTSTEIHTLHYITGI